jgi:hypothetical protein
MHYNFSCCHFTRMFVLIPLGMRSACLPLYIGHTTLVAVSLLVMYTYLVCVYHYGLWLEQVSE